MAGICGGIKNKVNIGDAVLFSPCWEWASGKVVPDDETGTYLEPAPHQISVAGFVSARAEQLREDSALWLELRNGFPVRSDTLPKLVVAPGASGPSVVAHADYAESLKLQHRKLTAIDMEAYGVMAAALSASVPKPTAFALKSVCDFADDEKDDRWQAYAAYISAQTIRTFFERNMHAIRELAGT
jgi:nucleoside phosphorylase